MSQVSASTITVVIVAYHGNRWMHDCIASLATETRTPSRIIVVDNSGNTGLDRLSFGSHAHLILKSPRAMGFAEANNFALTSAGLEDEYVCFLNQDTVTRRDWLSACIQMMRQNRRIGAMTPLLATYDGQGWDPNFLACARQAGSLEKQLLAGRSPEPWVEAPVIPAAAMVARTSALRQVGPFDPIFGSYYEDYDLCRRIQKEGYEVGICTGGAVGHFSGSATTTPEAERKRRRLVVRNRAIYMLRHEGDVRAQNLASYLVLQFARNLARSILRRGSALPLAAYLGAHRDLLPISKRLLSARYDKQCWEKYLQEIGWRNADSENRLLENSAAAS